MVVLVVAMVVVIVVGVVMGGGWLGGGFRCRWWVLNALNITTPEFSSG